MLSDVLEKIAKDKHIIETWKTLVSKDLKEFAKHTNPFKQLKVSNYYLYVDTKSFTYGIMLRGVMPNAARSRAFGAPVNQRVPSEPERIETDYGWRTVYTKRKTGRLGLNPLNTRYYGLSGQPTKFFGLKRGGKPQAFGLIGEQAVPVYSDVGMVEWLVESNMDEVEKILEEAGFKAIDGGLR